MNPLLSQFKSKNCTDIIKLEDFTYYDLVANNSFDYTCSKINFCPDVCCAKAFESMNNEKQTTASCEYSDLNPCYNISHGACDLSFTDNKDLNSLKQNLINVTCKCPIGYKFNTQYSKCIDIDECLEQSHYCFSFKQTCLNTIGSFLCECEHGYKKVLENGSEKCVLNEYYLDGNLYKWKEL